MRFFRRPAPLRLLLLAVLGLFPLLRLAAADAELTENEIRAGHRARTLLAKPRAGTSAPTDSVTASEALEQLRLVRSHPRFGGLRTLETDGKEDVSEVIKRLTATGLYDYVEPDYIRTPSVVPNDPSFATTQWSLNNTGQDGGTPGADIGAPAAWDIQREAPDVIVGIIDSGLYFSHEDIIGTTYINAAEMSGRSGIDDDGNGYIDDLIGINATVAKTSTLSSDPSDVDGHGSHVAGIIGASGDNGKGVTGVAWKTKILPMKFFSRSGGSVSAVIACLDYAINRGVHVINASYGSTSSSQAELDAMKRVRDAGIIFVAAAGNDGQEISTLPEYPAAYPLDNIVAVAATNRQDKIASYSTYGSGIVELAAPGSSILSLGISSPTSYATLSGTSMAAPHVTGAFALLKQKFPGENYRALINRLLSSVDELPALNHSVHTNGRLNLARALASTSIRPFNDDFARRATITGNTNTVRGSNQYATIEAGEPDHGVAGTTGSLWWTWTAPAGAGKLTLTTAGSGIDTVLALYTGTALTSLKQVAFNDDSAAGTTASSLTVEVTPGTTYQIAIAGKNAAEGLVTFRLAVIAANDSYATAQILTGPAAVAEGNNTAATRETGEPTLSRNARGFTLWYKWMAPANRRYQISAYGTSTDPIVGVFTGTGIAALTQVAVDDDSGPGLDSLVTLNATAGVTYSICVDSAAGAAGQFALSIADSEWQYVADFALNAAPAVGADGTVYFGDEFGIVHAVNPTGTRKWRYSLTGGYMDAGSITIAPDGTLYFGDDTGQLYALTPGATSATLKWKYKAGDYIWTAPALAADGTIYVKTDDGQLSAVNPDGTLRWKFAVHGDTYTSPVIAADGTVYLASDDNNLYAVNPDGTLKWKADLGASCYASPALGTDGTIYVGNYDGRFFALRPDGTERWHFDTGSPLSGSAAIDARGFIYFGAYDNKLYALNATTGVKQWEFATGDTIRSTCPVIADDGAIYIGSSDGLIYAVEPDGKLRRTFATSGTIYAAPVLAAGRLYVPSVDGKLYAFQIGSNLAASPWPMHRQNLRRLGRSEALVGFPTIATQPTAPASVTAGTPVSLSVGATVTSGTPTYQWLFNNVAIAGATSSTLALAATQTSDAGTYQVVITGPGGSLVSSRVTLNVTSGANNAARLINLAVRSTAGSGDKLLTVGLAVGGANTSGTKPLLVRAVGPTLSAFGITTPLLDPKLSIFASGVSTPLQENDNWSGNAAISSITPQVGAFGLSSATSKDAAILFSPSAGTYTAQVTAATGDPGIALAEIYDATPATAFLASTPRLINVSALTRVGTGDDVLIAGFAIGGTGSKRVLIRAIGPTLTGFGVSGILADPKLELYASGGTTPLSANDNWGQSANAQELGNIFDQVGAFRLALESKDAALLVTLQPGSYTAIVTGNGNATTSVGTALVEVYEVP